MTDALQVRIAHLEGAYAQVDKRLGGVESALIHLRSGMNSSFARVDGKIDSLSASVTPRLPPERER
jgi:hypothetical protein